MTRQYLLHQRSEAPAGPRLPAEGAGGPCSWSAGPELVPDSAGTSVPTLRWDGGGELNVPHLMSVFDGTCL